MDWRVKIDPNRLGISTSDSYPHPLRRCQETTLPSAPSASASPAPFWIYVSIAIPLDWYVYFQFLTLPLFPAPLPPAMAMTLPPPLFPGWYHQPHFGWARSRSVGYFDFSFCFLSPFPTPLPSTTTMTRPFPPVGIVSPVLDLRINHDATRLAYLFLICSLIPCSLRSYHSLWL